MISKCR